MKTLFIRIDVKGKWKGSEHRSTGAWDFDREDEHNGVSCYRVDRGWGVEQLRKYWTEYNMLRKIEEYTDKQVTIFEGTLTGDGPDFEDIAICEKTLAEVDAAEFMKKVFEVEEEFTYGDINENEYHEKLNELVQTAIA